MSIAREIAIILSALTINAGAAVAAGRHGSLTPSGVVTAALVGTAIFAAGGLGYWLMLMLFFVSSTALSRVGKSRKRSLETLHEKGSRRDAIQVVANGGAAAIAIVVARLTGSWWLAVGAAGGLAAANADTWASELGVLSRRRPRSIVSWKRLEPGVSGGVSLAGTLAALGGSLLIALWFLVASRWIGAWPVQDATRLQVAMIQEMPAIGGAAPSIAPLLSAGIAILLAGVAGTTFDSILGATIQAQYVAPEGTRTEKRGPEHTLVRGFVFMTNDVVNLASTLGATALAAVIARALAG